jgi:23S rRNA (guanosine2251-2'-O)-methyltransferase
MSKPPNNLITIYGRKPVLEALQQSSLQIYRVHLADSNQASPIIREIEHACRQREIECRYYDRLALSRISKNRKQDQGVAADIVNPMAQELGRYLETDNTNKQLLFAVDRVTNSQNLGMIIRSIAASTASGLILPRRGCAKLDSLVIKASAGTVFRCRLLFCDNLVSALEQAKSKQFSIYGLTLENSRAITDVEISPRSVMLLGNESDGISDEVKSICDHRIHIPLNNNVESLNVSVAAGIIAFRSLFSSSE